MSVVVGSETLQTLRASAALTLGYVASNSLDKGKVGTIELAFDFTKGSSSGFTFYVEESDDQTTWYEQSVYHDQPSQRADLAEVTITTTSKRLWRCNSFRRFVRVKAKGLVDITDTLLTISSALVRTVPS